MTSTYRPILLFKSAHIQNFLSSIGIRKRLLNWRYKKYFKSTKHLEIDAGNGVRLKAEIDEPNSPNNGLAIVIHGWEGSSQSNYVISIAAALMQQGMNVVRINMRDHGDSHGLNREIFNSSRTEEMVGATAWIMENYDYPKYFVAGFSLGGNFALRIGLNNPKLPKTLSGVTAVCPVINPSNSMQAIEDTISVYDRYFTRKWKSSLEKKLEHFPDYEYGKALGTLNTVSELNEYLIPRYTEFESLDDYFDSYTLSHER